MPVLLAHTFCQLYIIISYVFNHCDLQKTIPKYYHFVNVTSRGNNFLHKCYSNIMNAYAAVSKPLFGNSDLLAILLQPTYIKRLKAVPVTARTGKMWTDDAITELQGCLEATNMTNFRESTDNILWVCRQECCTSTCIPFQTNPVYPHQNDEEKVLSWAYSEHGDRAAACVQNSLHRTPVSCTPPRTIMLLLSRRIPWPSLVTCYRELVHGHFQWRWQQSHTQRRQPLGL